MVFYFVFIPTQVFIWATSLLYKLTFVSMAIINPCA